MARWAVIRVAASDGMGAQHVLQRAYAPVTMTVDPNPPAAGPEWEIAVQDRTEAAVCKLMAANEISVLARKTMLASPLLGYGE
jgi:hypothetical protein